MPPVRFPTWPSVDSSLPKNDGIQVVEAIRAAERFSDTPIVLASSSAKPPGGVNLKRLRVARCIPKPPDLESLLQIGVLLKKPVREPYSSRDR
jgi:CheY-like chemotaxis protein